jgi:transcriptional regulator EpsA
MQSPREVQRPPNAPTARAEAVLDAIEAAAQVRRRHHFFVWLQSSMGTLLPHDVAVCGAYNRARRTVVYEVFASVVLPAPLLQQWADPAQPAWQALTQRWVHQGCTAQAESLTNAPWCAGLEPLRSLGLTQLLVHGVSRPLRPAHVESLFILMSRPGANEAQPAHLMNLLVPHLHSAYVRAQCGEHAAGATALPPRPPAREAHEPALLTGRELEILGLVRLGMSNQAIGEALSISALTVKNHAQNIFRKLGVNNRTQAVACALSRQWLAHTAPH